MQRGQTTSIVAISHPKSEAYNNTNSASRPGRWTYGIHIKKGRVTGNGILVANITDEFSIEELDSDTNLPTGNKNTTRVIFLEEDESHLELLKLTANGAKEIYRVNKNSSCRVLFSKTKNTGYLGKIFSPFFSENIEHNTTTPEDLSAEEQILLLESDFHLSKINIDINASVTPKHAITLRKNTGSINNLTCYGESISALKLSSIEKVNINQATIESGQALVNFDGISKKVSIINCQHPVMIYKEITNEVTNLHDKINIIW